MKINIVKTPSLASILGKNICFTSIRVQYNDRTEMTGQLTEFFCHTVEYRSL